jgi:polyhydroxyalkanoate synthesis regulator phasin
MAYTPGPELVPMEESNAPKGVSMKKILTSMIAAGILVAGVAVAGVVAGSSAEAQTPDDETAVEKPERGSAIKGVLDDLVAENEITQGQADTIIAALEEKWEELRANRPEGFRRHGPGFGRGFRSGARFGFHMAELLEDGVIDAAELAELPDGHPLTNPDGPFGDALQDGEITAEELRDVHDQLREQRRERFDGDVEGTSL